MRRGHLQALVLLLVAIPVAALSASAPGSSSSWRGWASPLVSLPEARRLVGPDAPASAMVDLLVLDVPYRTDSGQIRRGRVLCHRRAAPDLLGLFDTLFVSGFPLASVRPVADFGFSDSLSMVSDNTSAFNWRRVKGTARLSAHAQGLAIDLNPWRNPFAHRKGNRPRGAVHDPSVPGTLTDTSLAVVYLRRRGWWWGGRWPSGRDWQHFELPLLRRLDRPVPKSR